MITAAVTTFLVIAVAFAAVQALELHNTRKDLTSEQDGAKYLEQLLTDTRAKLGKTKS